MRVMRTRTEINKMRRVSCALAAIWLSTSAMQGTSSKCGDKSGVSFRIVTDMLVYAPKSTMRVDILVTNKAEVPLYFFRTLSQCSSQLGSYLLLIVDRKKQEVPVQRCSADLLMDKLDVAEMLTNPKLGILLGQGDVYGLEEEFELPGKSAAMSHSCSKRNLNRQVGRVTHKRLEV
jgi:hypothetical protein